jgi:hypothetical protein
VGLCLESPNVLQNMTLLGYIVMLVEALMVSTSKEYEFQGLRALRGIQTLQICGNIVDLKEWGV